MKSVGFVIFLITGFVSLYAEVDLWEAWQGRDTVVIGNSIYEYELYDFAQHEVDGAVPQIIEDFWDGYGSSHDASRLIILNNRI